MKNIFLPSAMLATALALPACGGGGGGNQTATSPAPVGATNPGNIPGTPTPADGDSGSVSAPYAKGNAAQYVLISASEQIYGNLTTYTQATDGAVTAMDENTLTGQTAVKDINGDANFAL